MTIRPVVPADVARVVEIARSAWQPIYDGYRDTLGPELFACLFADWKARKTRTIEQACRGEGNDSVLVTEIDGRIAGFITLNRDPDGLRGVIGNNAVDPAFQGHGVASAMYRHTIALMREWGLKAVSVTTGSDAAHAPARRAYEKAGFQLAVPSVTYHRLL